MQEVCKTHFECKHLLTRCYKRKQLRCNLLLLSIFYLKTKSVINILSSKENKKQQATERLK